MWRVRRNNDLSLASCSAKSPNLGKRSTNICGLSATSRETRAREAAASLERRKSRRRRRRIVGVRLLTRRQHFQVRESLVKIDHCRVLVAAILDLLVDLVGTPRGFKADFVEKGKGIRNPPQLRARETGQEDG